MRCTAYSLSFDAKSHEKRYFSYVCCRTEGHPSTVIYLESLTIGRKISNEQFMYAAENKKLMSRKPNSSSALLIVEDVTETRDGIEKLLKADGYRVSVARDERDGIESAQRNCPDLILVSLAGLPRQVILTARRIRERAEVGDEVPVVIFCIEEVDEGDEVALGQNVHVTRPDNFNQLRSLITRLLAEGSQGHPSSITHSEEEHVH